MKAVVTNNHNTISYEDVPIPILNNNEVLIKVLASSVNNTDINTRIGWYSDTKSGWKGSTVFPIIQGTDCCGIVVKVNNIKDEYLLDKRVLVKPCQDNNNWIGSECNGTFSEYMKTSSNEVYIVNCDWSDIELGVVPCVYGTSENMLDQVKLSKNETVLITGASGGVGIASIQLSLRRGAKVIAITNKNKVEFIKSLGCTVFKDISELGENCVDVVIDNVGYLPICLKLLKTKGRYVTSGAIRDPNVSLDMRDLYLKDIKMFGCTEWDLHIFPNLISYIEKNEFRPIIYKEYHIQRIKEAQEEFLKKNHIGKISLFF